MSVFPHDVSKTNTARITNQTYKYSTMSRGNPFIVVSKGHNGRRHRLDQPFAERFADRNR